MFSGLKSYLFGYATEPVLSAEENNSANTSNNSGHSLQPTAERNGRNNDTSALLEQTLNSATTKLTEQLLPASPSIEQLQSSSHQLLPSLNDQLAEDEAKKRQSQLVASNIAQLEGDDDDDDRFNADSWELLDLVEQPDLTVQSHPSSSVTVKTSGILKQTSSVTIDTDASQGLEKSNSLADGQRQKPKVSFETPDLVNEIQKIEPVSATSNHVKSIKNKKSKKRNKAKSSCRLDDGSVRARGPSQALIADEAPLEKPAKQGTSEKCPVLNYAAALLAKPRKSYVIGDINEKGSDQLPSKKVDTKVSPQASGAFKRNRPVSTSSWSSSDDIEAVDATWNDIQAKQVLPCDVTSIYEACTKKVSTAIDDEQEDNQSIASSEFSDCDYGYPGLNDYIVRPKKGQAKRANSFISKRGQEQLVSSATIYRKVTESQQSKSDSSKNGFLQKNKCASSANQTKPKKKKIILSNSSQSLASIYLRKECNIINSSSSNQLKASTSSYPVEAVKTVANVVIVESNPPKKNEDSIEETSASLMPPPVLSNLMASSISGNDSSDIAEMDESWFVTPPPCFTGSNKNDEPKTKAKEAARENALIEHPSIYIANLSSKHSGSIHADTSSGASNKKASSKQVTASVKSSIPKSKKKPSSIQQGNEYKLKSWDNKFIVSSWAFDEQGDLNDFDNLFLPDIAKVKSGNTKKKQQQQKKTSSSGPEPKLLVDPPHQDILDCYESDLESDDLSPAVVGLTDISSDLSLVEIEPSLDTKRCQSEQQLLEEPEVPVVVENVITEDKNENDGCLLKPISKKKAPISVQPIEPERQPAWQLKKKRSKRRPLGLASLVNVTTSSSSPKTASVSNEDQLNSLGKSSGSGKSSPLVLSSPSLIDRIGSSIVSNLTSGFGSVANSFTVQPKTLVDEMEKLDQTVMKGSNSEANIVNRRRLAKSFLDRQNDCAKFSGSIRRANRRLKMHTTLNGVSVNRKVHTSFH